MPSRVVLSSPKVLAIPSKSVFDFVSKPFISLTDAVTLAPFNLSNNCPNPSATACEPSTKLACSSVEVVTAD